MREQGQVDPNYPAALPILSDLTEKEARKLEVLFGSLSMDGTEYIYTGPIEEDGASWHDAEEADRVGGIFYLADRMQEFL